MDIPLSLVLEGLSLEATLSFIELSFKAIKIDTTTYLLTWLSNEPLGFSVADGDAVRFQILSGNLLRIWVQCELLGPKSSFVRGRLALSTEAPSHYGIDIMPFDVPLWSNQFSDFLEMFCATSPDLDMKLGEGVKARIGVSASDVGEWNSEMATSPCPNLSSLELLYRTWRATVLKEIDLEQGCS